ncbi:MAG: hypothetical protein MJY60_00985 [Bacteroidales bacterium]|nr:hypothetical protein [Bacteroidales bacterium]
MEENEKNEKFEEIKDKIEDKFEDVKEEVKETYADVKENVKDTIEDIKKEIDDYTAEQDPQDVQDNKVMAVLAYIGILVLIPLFAAKKSKFAKFHTNQGLILCIIAIACNFLRKVPVVGWIFGIVDLVVFVLAVVGIVYAVQGKAKELPVVGNWKLLK